MIQIFVFFLADFIYDFVLIHFDFSLTNSQQIMEPFV